MGEKEYLFVLLCCYAVALVVAAGPVWPETFRVDFHEILYSRPMTYDYECEGRWYYDVTNNRARFDHYQGQLDNFCQGQGLSDFKRTDDCHLLFSPDTAMYVHYPNQKTCCRLCAPGVRCTPLKPNWIENATMEGIEKVTFYHITYYHIPLVLILPYDVPM